MRPSPLAPGLSGVPSAVSPPASPGLTGIRPRGVSVSGLSVSVVIPAYRAARTINRAADSALGQTRQPAEVLVVDDGSLDGADLAAALIRYDGRVTLLRKPNGGAAIGAETCST